jgi:hypothetical protein
MEFSKTDSKCIPNLNTTTFKKQSEIHALVIIGKWKNFTYTAGSSLVY